MYSNNDEFYKKQIITYLGNKRKFVGIIEEIIKTLENKTKQKLSIGDGFSGSGILSRSGGIINGSFFFTKNSSLVLVFSFLNTFPASLRFEQETRKAKTIIEKSIFFICQFFTKKSKI